MIKKMIMFISTIIASLECKKNLFGKVYVNFPSKFTSNCVFGQNVHFNGIKILGSGRVVFGNNFHSGKMVKFLTTNHNYDKGTRIPYDDTFISKDIIIHDNVWIGDNVLVLGGVEIEEGAIIQAGSVVVSNVGYCEVVGGAPARKFKLRDIDHYEKLKNNNMFF